MSSKLTAGAIGALSFFLISCGAYQSRQAQRSEPQSKTQIVDVLKDLPTADVLDIKYGGESGFIRLDCQLTGAPQRRVGLFNSRPIKINPLPGSPVQQPAPHYLIYDLNLQRQIDPQLAEEVSVELVDELQTAQLHLEFKPLYFSELLNIQYESARYILKYTPVLEYSLDYQTLDGGTPVRGRHQGRIFERVDHLVSLGRHRLACRMETSLNNANSRYYEEFQQHWSCVGCVNIPITPPGPSSSLL